MRDVAERLEWFLANKPVKAGRCAEHTMNALGVEKQGFDHATQMAEVVLKAGRMQTGPCPKGAIRYWTGGSKGYGHVAIEAADLLDPAAVASVDVKGPGTVGVVSLAWITNNWGAGIKGLRYRGWSWWFGGINTDPAPPKPPSKPDGTLITGSTVTRWRDYSGKPKTMQVVAADNKWHQLVGIDVAAPPITGEEQHALYARLGFLWRQDGSTGMAVCECKWVRDGGTPDKPADDDPTAYKELHFEHGTKSVPFDQLHLEEGEAGVGGSWWMRFSGGIVGVEVTTRYAKTYVTAITG